MVVAADEAQDVGDVLLSNPASDPPPTMAGERSRSSISVPARLRLCASSPICSIWVRMPVTSGASSVPRTAACSRGPSTSPIQRSRVSTSDE